MHRFAVSASPAGFVIPAEGFSPAAGTFPRRAEALGSHYEGRLRGLSTKPCITPSKEPSD